MNNYFDTMSEQLTAYLDGELPSDMHETLFEELARNPQLREEMNEHLLIRSAVQKDNVLPSTRVLDNLLAAVESGDSFVPVAHESSISGLST
ncbi:MAG TPA: RseA family anti-sigma factor, partial [Candidatus Kapabacteria bacterium]|nr:RseA family anti-sigma factor [Candidatus Kapabacteria bacterium]